MSLNLYRRHRRECAAGHEEDSRSGELDERRKNWKRCDCPIIVAGTLARQFKRQSTGQWEWESAQSVARNFETNGSWNGPVNPPMPVEAAVIDALPAPAGVTIDRAITAFLTEFERHAALNTQRKYRTLLAKLRAFADHRGYRFVDQWTPVDVREMRATWTVSAQTAAKNMSTIKSFFEFCVASEWLSRNPARLIRNPKTRDAAETRTEQKLPFSDDELRRMYEASRDLYGKQEIKWSREIHGHQIKGEYARYNRKWTGQDLADFISVSVYTGLRIADVCTFDASRMLATGEILLRTTKAGTHVYTWVPEWLQERIRNRAEQHGPRIFGEHRTQDMNVVTDVWRRKLKKLWALCGPWPEEPTPHRFRHTFARILLQRPGVTIRDVAELLGNSEQMVRKHYAAWIPERQARLTRVLKEAFADRVEADAVPSRADTRP